MTKRSAVHLLGSNIRSPCIFLTSSIATPSHPITDVRQKESINSRAFSQSNPVDPMPTTIRAQQMLHILSHSTSLNPHSVSQHPIDSAASSKRNEKPLMSCAMCRFASVTGQPYCSHIAHQRCLGVHSTQIKQGKENLPSYAMGYQVHTLNFRLDMWKLVTKSLSPNARLQFFCMIRCLRYKALSWIGTYRDFPIIQKKLRACL